MFDIRTDRRSLRWSRLVAAPLGVAALVGLAACGTSTDASAASSGSAPTSAAGGAGSTAADSAMAAYTSCMEENGVTMPEPQAGRGGGGTRPQGDAGGTPPSGAPEPPVGGGQGGGRGGPGGGTPGGAPEGVDADTWAAAQEACADLAPGPPGGAASSAGSGS